MGRLHFLFFLEYVDMRALGMARENKVEMRGLAQIRMSITGMMMIFKSALLRYKKSALEHCPRG